jgi:hypothetical protein
MRRKKKVKLGSVSLTDYDLESVAEIELASRIICHYVVTFWAFWLLVLPTLLIHSITTFMGLFWLIDSIFDVN